MARPTRITQDLSSRKRRAGERHIPADLLEDPTYIPRLTWRIREPESAGQISCSDEVRSARDTAFFCDNSIFDDEMDPDLLEALLDAPGRLVLTPQVKSELAPWLADRPRHRLAQALAESHPGIGERCPPEPGVPGRNAFDYYVALLSWRRRLKEIARDNFVSEYRREPATDAELLDYIQRCFGQRARLLASKPSSPLRTDEILVYLAVEHALRTGTSTVVLTSDPDVEEQFYKLVWMIDFHYRAHLLADSYVEEFGRYRLRPFPASLPSDPRWPFEERGAYLIDLPANSALDWFLPARFRFVPIACVTIGRARVSTVTFGAEQEMSRVLHTKDVTGGLSTARLGERNIHVWLAPLPLPPGDAWCAAIAQDLRLPAAGTSVRIPALDLNQALITSESHHAVVGMDQRLAATSSELRQRLWLPRGLMQSG